MYKNRYILVLGVYRHKVLHLSQLFVHNVDSLISPGPGEDEWFGLDCPLLSSDWPVHHHELPVHHRCCSQSQVSAPL